MWPERESPYGVPLDPARDKSLIDVSSARGLNESRSSASLSSRTRAGRHGLSSSSSCALFLYLSLFLSRHQSSNHMRLLDTYISQSTSVSVDKSILHMSSPLWSSWKLYLQWWCPAEQLAAVIISQQDPAGSPSEQELRCCFLWSATLRNGFTVVRKKLDSVKSPVDPWDARNGRAILERCFWVAITPWEEMHRGELYIRTVGASVLRVMVAMDWNHFIFGLDEVYLPL